MMDKGEVTKGAALALSAAVEAIVAAESHQELDPLVILRYLRKQRQGEDHRFSDNSHVRKWEFEFENWRGFRIFPLRVRVTLLCNHGRLGHDWHGRSALVIESNETRPGEYTIDLITGL